MSRTPNTPQIRAITALASLVGCVAAMPGCGLPSVSGGTPGIVTIDGQPVLDLQVVLYSVATGEMAGFGVTGGDGRFELVSEGAKGPVTLEPGKYSATIESVGAPVELPTEYLDPQATPVQLDWREDDEIEIKLSGIPLQ